MPILDDLLCFDVLFVGYNLLLFIKIDKKTAIRTDKYQVR
jgi:hypothetical protein